MAGAIPQVTVVMHPLLLQILETGQCLFARALSSTGVVVIGSLAILSHRLYFIRDEHHLKAPSYLLLWVLSSLLLGLVVFVSNFYAPPCRDGGSTGQAVGALPVVLAANGSFVVPLFGSMIVYRVFEHPLKCYKGPRWAAVSKLWHLLRVIRTSNHVLLDELYHKYGSIVRTGK